MVVMQKQGKEGAMEGDLFGRSVHDLVEARGVCDLLKEASNHVKENGRNTPLDILSGRRGARTIRAAAARAEKDAGTLFGDVDAVNPRICAPMPTQLGRTLGFRGGN